MDTSNYKQTEFGLYVPAHIADKLQHLDMTTVALYEAHLKNAGKAESTIQKYTRFAMLFTIFLGDHFLSVSYVRAWLDIMKKTHHIKTVNIAVSALNGLFKYLGRLDCVVDQFPYQEPQYLDDDRYLEKKDLDKLLAVADDRMKTMILTFSGTGIRVSELRFFTVESVRTSRVTVDNKGKTRVVFIDPVTRTVILDYCEKHGINSGIIFHNRVGAALNRTYIWRCLKKLAEKAGVTLSKVFPHNLRHLFAVERFSIDKDIEALRLDMGHSMIATTQRYLKETSGKHFERVMERGRGIAI